MKIHITQTVSMIASILIPLGIYDQVRMYAWVWVLIGIVLFGQSCRIGNLMMKVAEKNIENINK